jgi:hypothetical protein
LFAGNKDIEVFGVSHDSGVVPERISAPDDEGDAGGVEEIKGAEVKVLRLHFQKIVWA